jgi:hypothetical protein
MVFVDHGSHRARSFQRHLTAISTPLYGHFNAILRPFQRHFTAISTRITPSTGRPKSQIEQDRRETEKGFGLPLRSNYSTYVHIW